MSAIEMLSHVKVNRRGLLRASGAAAVGAVFMSGCGDGLRPVQTAPKENFIYDGKEFFDQIGGLVDKGVEVRMNVDFEEGSVFSAESCSWGEAEDSKVVRWYRLTDTNGEGEIMAVQIMTGKCKAPLNEKFGELDYEEYVIRGVVKKGQEGEFFIHINEMIPVNPDLSSSE